MRRIVELIILFLVAGDTRTNLTRLFVQNISFQTNGLDQVDGIVYGNSDYGYFELSDFRVNRDEILIELVPPGYHSSLHFYVKKKEALGTHRYSFIGTRKFRRPSVAEFFTPLVGDKQSKFSANFFLGKTSTDPIWRREGNAMGYIVNKFGELVWLYEPLAKTGNSFDFIGSWEKGTYVIVPRKPHSPFQVFGFDGKVVFARKFATELHHDLSYEGGAEVLVLNNRYVRSLHPFNSKRERDYAIGGIVALKLESFQLESRWDLLWSGLFPFDKDWEEDPKEDSRDTYDVAHLNSIQHVAGKGYLISLRKLSTLLLLDETFQLLWSLGPGSMATINTKGEKFEFYRQHHATFLSNGNILLFDNGRKTSRVLELSLEAKTKQVRLVQEMRPREPFYAEILGSAYRLPNGHTVALFTNRNVQKLIEFDGRGQETVLKEVSTHNGYRMQPIDSIGRETYLGPQPPGEAERRNLVTRSAREVSSIQ